MARLRAIPWQLWLYATAVVVMGLQFIGWHRVTDGATAGARAVGRTIAPALTVGWPVLVAFAIGTVAPRWLPAIGGGIRGRSRRPSENWMPGLAVTICLAIGLLLACVLVFPRLLYPPLTESQLSTVAPTRIGPGQPRIPRCPRHRSSGSRRLQRRVDLDPAGVTEPA